jgi:excisionase family DNA binding protein
VASTLGDGHQLGARPRAIVDDVQHQGGSPGHQPARLATPALRALKTLPERLLTVAEVAATLSVCQATIYKLCERGELAHVRISTSIRFERHHLGAFLARQRSG